MRPLATSWPPDWRTAAANGAAHRFSNPGLLAPLSVYAQLAIGLAFVLGLMTRWAGILCAVHFIVAIALVDRFGGPRMMFPAGCLVVIGFFLATHGAGRLSFDAALRANERPRSQGVVTFKK